MPLSGLAKILMIFGASLFVVGLVLYFGARAGLGQLPGDISFRRGNTTFFFPLVTGILLSIGLTIVLNIILRFFR